MISSLTYRIDKTAITVQNMHFNIINRRPNYPKKEQETVKAEIGKQLFTVFSKYEQP